MNKKIWILYIVVIMYIILFIVSENYLELIKKNGIASNNAGKIDSLFDKDKDGDIIFPKYISGIYINSNNDLVIQLIEKKIPKIYSKEYITYKKVLSSCNNLIIEYVNDLNESGNKVINDLYVY